MRYTNLFRVEGVPLAFENEAGRTFSHDWQAFEDIIGSQLIYVTTVCQNGDEIWLEDLRDDAREWWEQSKKEWQEELKGRQAISARLEKGTL